jgi:DNA-directed RNA polymerase subunit RPC12/RpoP
MTDKNAMIIEQGYATLVFPGGHEQAMSYRCKECGRLIDWLDAMLTATYHLCPQCLSEAIRTKSPVAKRALRPIKREQDES